MPKSTKRFRLTNSAVNSQGFRMLTSGAELDGFEGNPLLLFNHIRPEGNQKDQILPIGRWEDLEVVGDDIYATPFFDDSDPFAMSIFNKVEAGIIKMCSVGADPIETSDDPKLILKGQTHATVTKWRMVEGSICDIGANPDAITVALYDKNNRVIQLGGTIQNTIIPKLIEMTKQTKRVQLADDPEMKDPAIKEADDANQDDPAAQDPAIKEADDETPEDKMARLTQENEDLKARLSDLEKQLKLAEENEESKQAEQLADKAITMRKITAGQKPMIVKMALADWNNTVEYLNSIPKGRSVKETLSKSTDALDGDRIRVLASKSYDELFRLGELTELKLSAPDIYAQKHKSKFGKEPINTKN